MKAVLNKIETKFLLKKAHSTYGTNVVILLNVALILTLREWTDQSGFVIEQENHGRHIIDLDVGRTWLVYGYVPSLDRNYRG